MSAKEPLYRFGLLWTQVEFKDDLSGDGVTLLRRLKEVRTEKDLHFPGSVLHKPSE